MKFENVHRLDQRGFRFEDLEVVSSRVRKELRSALYQGALSYICRLPDEPKTAKQAWLIKLVERAGIKRTCIALANQAVRTAWAMLRYENKYEQQPLLAI